jgi:hypothetical protein
VFGSEFNLALDDRLLDAVKDGGHSSSADR